jgi:hypothetical protein
MRSIYLQLTLPAAVWAALNLQQFHPSLAQRQISPLQFEAEHEIKPRQVAQSKFLNQNTQSRTVVIILVDIALIILQSLS